MYNKQMPLALSVVLLIFISSLVSAGLYQIIKYDTIVRIACIGDSITELSGYPSKLQFLLGANYSVSNFGVSGSTVSCDNKIAYMEQKKFHEALAFQPDVVIIMLGTNDANLKTANDPDISEDYKQIVNSFRALTSQPDIMMVQPPPIYSDSSGYNNTYLINNVIPTINSVAEHFDLHSVDMYSALNDSKYFADGIHPNNEGSTVIASTVYQAIENKLGYSGLF
jgi:lysophospholipase L1-like esterase